MPKAGLTREAVVATAGDVADEVGWDRLTLAEVANRLDVKLPSLYKHIDSLDGLRRDVSVSALRDLSQVLSAAAVGKSESAALQAIAAAYRSYAKAFPGRYAATVRAPAGDARHVAAADAVVDVVLAVLDGYGIRGAPAIDATRALRAAMHGFVSIELAGGFGLPRDVDRSFRRMVDALDVALRAGYTRSR